MIYLSLQSFGESLADPKVEKQMERKRQRERERVCVIIQDASGPYSFTHSGNYRLY